MEAKLLQRHGCLIIGSPVASRDRAPRTQYRRTASGSVPRAKAETAALHTRRLRGSFVGLRLRSPRSWCSLPLRRLAERRREEMLWNVEERKPAAIRRREVVDRFDDNLDCLIAGMHFDANLRVCKIYFVSTTIAAADDGVGHVNGSPWLAAVLA